MLLHPYGTYQNSDTHPIARVLKGSRGSYEIGTDTETLRAFYHGEDPPIIGDWVQWSGSGDGVRITQIMPRQSVIKRKAAGKGSRAQIMAANLDYLLIVTAADQDFNPRRLERYLAMAWDGGVMPVLVVNKIDLCQNPQPYLDTLADIAPGVNHHLIAAADDCGLNELDQYHRDGRTIALVGSSGVGKSTIVNHLLGHETMATRSGRSGDGKGRHTTTHRELHRLPGGGIVIDTPGLREIQPIVDQDALDQTFGEIPDHAAACKFRNCSHQGEPGCAVLEAVEDGELDADRLNNYHKMSREMDYLNSRTDKQAALARKRADKSLHKLIRKLNHR